MNNWCVHWIVASLLSFVSAQESLFCYYTSWARYRPFPGNYSVPNIDPDLCTHILYAFADITDGTIQYGDDGDPAMYSHLQALKLRNPSLRTLLSIGGFTAGSEPFSKITADETSRLKFATSAIEHLRTHGFDGLDIDWEYPLRIEGGKEAFSNLIMYMRTVFEAEGAMQKRPRLLLTAALAGGEWAVDASYNIPLLAMYLDYGLLLTYDFHGTWENRTGLHSAFAGRHPGDNMNLQWGVNKYHASGMPKNKIIVGMGTFGRSWGLSDPADRGVGAPASGPGAKGEYTQESGILGYNEICVRLQLPGWTTVTDPIQMVPYAIHEDQWIGYEDPTSAALKANYIKAQGLGGAMFWSLAMDDFQGMCSMGHAYPIIRTVKRVFDDLNAAGRAATLAQIVAGMGRVNHASAPITFPAEQDSPVTGKRADVPFTGQFPVPIPIPRPMAAQPNTIARPRLDEPAAAFASLTNVVDTNAPINLFLSPTPVTQMVAAANARTMMAGFLPGNAGTNRDDVVAREVQASSSDSIGVPLPIPVYIEQVQSTSSSEGNVDQQTFQLPSTGGESLSGQVGVPHNTGETQETADGAQSEETGSPLGQPFKEAVVTAPESPGPVEITQGPRRVNGAVLGFAPMGTLNSPRPMFQGQPPFFPFRPMPYEELGQSNTRHGLISRGGIRYEPGQPPIPERPRFLLNRRNMIRGQGRRRNRPPNQRARGPPFSGRRGGVGPVDERAAKEGRQGEKDESKPGVMPRRKFTRGKNRQREAGGRKAGLDEDFKYLETVYSNSPTPGVQCPEEFAVFRDPNDCGVYYRCLWSKPRMFRCLEGLLFDEKSKICNWPSVVEEESYQCFMTR